MGIINLTGDSFSGDGLADDVDRALTQAQRMVAEGAHILDVGAESTRPGAEPVPEAVELARLVPAVQALTALNVPISVDTMKPRVMAAALAAGADMVNDIAALQSEAAIAAVAQSQAAVCLMHMQGQPRTMQSQPHYDDVVPEVYAFLQQRMAAAVAGGVARERIVVDPGFGFGKTVEHNYALLARLAEFARLERPILVGMSRKSMLGAVTGRPVQERQAASAAAALLAAERGAGIIRVHDVAATKDALAVWQALRQAERHE